MENIRYFVTSRVRRMPDSCDQIKIIFSYKATQSKKKKTIVRVNRRGQTVLNACATFPRGQRRVCCQYFFFVFRFLQKKKSNEIVRIEYRRA